jgi:hypothetical protein
MAPMTSSDDLADAGRLLAYCAKPKDRPARDAQYQRLLVRYTEEPDFAVVCDVVAAGAGLTLMADDDVGIIATAAADSPLRMPLSHYMARTNPTAGRALSGLVLLAVVKVCYPQPQHLDDALRVGRVSVAGVADYLERQVAEFAGEAEDADADRPEDREMWREWEALRRGRAGAVRASAKDRIGLVKKVCAFLEAEGLLQKASDDDEGTWRATPRMRLVARSIAEDSDLFRALLAAAAPTADDAVETPPVADDEIDEAALCDAAFAATSAGSRP